MKFGVWFHLRLEWNRLEAECKTALLIWGWTAYIVEKQFVVNPSQSAHIQFLPPSVLFGCVDVDVDHFLEEFPDRIQIC